MMASKSKITELTVEQLSCRFEYLDALRDSGATNMFGAGAYVEAQFGDSRQLSGSVLASWMNHFDGETGANERARAAIARATGAA